MMPSPAPQRKLSSLAELKGIQKELAALKLVDVRVLDHIIVAPGQSYSFAERGLI